MDSRQGGKAERMSEVKRYSFWPQIVHLPGGGGVRAEVHFKVEEDGLFVAHQDYARLKAEVERLKVVSTIEQRTIQGLQQTPEWSDIARLTAECRRLEAENSRLRASSFVTAVPVEQYERVVKAGDIIARIIAPPAHGPGEWDGEWYAWHNAKSGVLSDETPPNTPPPAL